MWFGYCACLIHAVYMITLCIAELVIICCLSDVWLHYFRDYLEWIALLVWQSRIQFITWFCLILFTSLSQELSCQFHWKLGQNFLTYFTYLHFSVCLTVFVQLSESWAPSPHGKLLWLRVNDITVWNYYCGCWTIDWLTLSSLWFVCLWAVHKESAIVLIKTKTKTLCSDP